jgi:hypothetical protein
MQPADVMSAINNTITNSPILDRNLEESTLVIMIKSPSVTNKTRVRDEQIPTICEDAGIGN